MERDEGMRGEVGEVMAEDEMLAGGVLWGGGGHVLAIAIVVQVYHKRRPTLGLLILPSVPSFSPTIRRTARISIPPIEPNLAERAMISAINLDDYQFDPLTPPPSPSSPFTMATTKMIA
ncbi:hypothetical protein Tco_0479128 [Tanacetum coccineum]